MDVYFFMFDPQVFMGILIALFLLPAAIFTGLESHWGYMDSIYYCFVSLTTVGLGDFIPGDTPGQHLRPLYKACTTCKCIYLVTFAFATNSLILPFSLPTDRRHWNDATFDSFLQHSRV